MTGIFNETDYRLMIEACIMLSVSAACLPQFLREAAPAAEIDENRCPWCEGSGQGIQEECPACEGEGVL